MYFHHLKPKGIETIKKIAVEKKEEKPDEKEQIVDVDSKVKKRLLKIKEDKKVEKKAAKTAITQTRKKKIEKPDLTVEEKKIKRRMDREDKVKMTLASIQDKIKEL